MPARNKEPVRQPFGEHDYEIVFPQLKASREVHILAMAALPLRVGDHYTISPAGCLFDIVVEEISRPAGGRWNARCKVADPR
jgi:hypothetical protein